MKVEVNELDKKQIKAFPKLMGTKNGYIVLFSKPEKGVCLKKPESTADIIGSYYDEWNMDYFEDFNGSITLSND